MALVTNYEKTARTVVRGFSHSLFDILNFCHFEYILYPKGATIGSRGDHIYNTHALF